MQLLATAELMQRFDRTAIRSLAIPGLVLMENAGRACAEELARRFSPLEGTTVIVVCGKGNNGGDGCVIARHLANMGARVTVAVLARKRSISGDGRTNLDALWKIAQLPGSGVRIIEVLRGRDLRKVGNAQIIVDAIFGTGFSGEVRGVYREAIDWINTRQAHVVAVDVPSGVDASSGEVANVAVRASLTVTMGLPKIGHFIGQGCDLSGEVVVVDIGIPRAVMRAAPDQAYRVSAPDVASVLPQRPRNAHKYSVGKVLVLAGSRAFTGAPVMTALAALRSGAGAVIVGIPKSIHAILAKRLTEVIMAPMEETPSGSLSAQALSAIRDKAAWADCIALGPGLSRDEETLDLVRKILATIDKPILVDADGLTAFSGHSDVLRKRKGETILTPHTGEFALLTGTPSTVADTQRVTIAREAARALKAVLVLKGAPTVVGEPRGDVYVNSSGNPGMATIGSGDVLTGLIAGLKAQGMPSAAAAYAGVFLHGCAGDLAAARYGRRSLLAGDIGECIPLAFREVGAW